jgi:hypothetical protein
MAQLRTDLPPLPPNIAKLPIDDRGYPVPWFVGWVNGKPEFRSADRRKLVAAIKQDLCWVCGKRIAGDKVFVIGPMCTINRVSSEPPSHQECAEFSVQGCPFLSKPHMVRSERPMPDGRSLPPPEAAAGYMIERNPGVIACWYTSSWSVFPDGSGRAGKFLFRIGEPKFVDWWTLGRRATREEVRAAIAAGLPSLMTPAQQEGDDAVRRLARMAKDAEAHWPTEVMT